MTTMISIALIAIALLAVLALIFHWALLRGLAVPRIAHDRLPNDVLSEAASVRELWLSSHSGKKLFAWLLMPPDHDNKNPCPASLVMHGWGSNASMMLSTAQPLLAAGHGALFIDARSHGRSEAEAFMSLPRFAEDIETGLNCLRNTPGVDANKISLIGHSVGAAAVLLYASRNKDICGVISLSAFAHPAEVMQRWMIEHHVSVRFLGKLILNHVQRVIGARFEDIAPINTVTKIRCPILLVHGRDDDTVPVSDAERIASVTPLAQLLIIDGDHDLRETLSPYARELIVFLRTACAVDRTDVRSDYLTTLERTAGTQLRSSSL